MIGVALKSLWGRKTRSALTAISIVLGTAMIAGTFVVRDQISGAFNEIFQTGLEKTDVLASKKTAFISNNGAQGVGVTGGAGGAASVVIESSQISENASHGVEMVSNARLSFTGSSSTQNAGSGIITDAAGTDADVSHSTLAFNGGAGITSVGGSTSRLFSSSVQHNAVSVSGTVQSTGNNEVLNNTTNTLPANLGSQ